MKYNIPNRNMRYVICDICGFKYHRKDTTQITDKYNRHYGLIVCHKDRDVTNQQSRPVTNATETLISRPQYVRPREDFNFYSQTLANQLPGQPVNCLCVGNPLSNYVDLYWEQSGSAGVSPITGYMITRANPQGAYQFTVISNTNNSVTYYSDISSDNTQQYSYQVAAINSVGTGPLSVLFFWPSNDMIWSDVQFLVCSQNNYTISANGNGIRINHTTSGII